MLSMYFSFYSLRMPTVLTNGYRTIEIVGICETLILTEGKLYAYTTYSIGKMRNVVNVKAWMHQGFLRYLNFLRHKRSCTLELFSMFCKKATWTHCQKIEPQTPISKIVNHSAIWTCCSPGFTSQLRTGCVSPARTFCCQIAQFISLLQRASATI